MDRQLRCIQVILSWMTYDTLYLESETNDKDSGVEDTKQDDVSQVHCFLLYIALLNISCIWIVYCINCILFVSHIVLFCRI